MPISKRDLELLQEATLELHRPRDVAALRALAPVVIKRAIPADAFVWFESGHGRIEDVRREAVLWDSPRVFRKHLLQRLMSMMDRHPFTQHVERTGELGPLRLSDFWSRRQLVRSDLYRQVMRHVGVGWMLGIAIVRGPRAGTLTLARSPAARDFSERDRTMMKLLAPHFSLALSAAELATGNRAEETRALEHLGLTPREADVAAWLARGRTNPEIASILAMKPRTVEKHVENILGKLGVENRTTAAGVVLGVAAAGTATARTNGASARATVLRVLRPAPAKARLRPARGAAGAGRPAARGRRR